MSADDPPIGVGAAEAVAPDPVRSSKRRRRIRRGLLWGGISAAVIVGVVVAMLVWPDPPGRATGESGLRMDRTEEPAGPLRIIGVDAPLVWVSSEHVEVTITVTNEGSATVLARVWWLLAEPGDPDPWTDPIVQPDVVPIGIEPGERERVTVPIDLGLVPSGAYRLSLWAHIYDADTESWEHSDGRSLLSTIRVTAPTQGLTHVGGTSDRLWIQAVTTPQEWRAGDPATVTVSVANAAPELASVRLWWYLSPTASETPWDVEGSVQSETISGTADPGNLTDLVVPLGRLPDAGTYRLTAWLHQRESSASTPRDGVLVDRPVTIID